MPTGLYVIGSVAPGGREPVADRRWNLMTASWVMQTSKEPKTVSVGVERSALTAALVSEGGGFAVSLLWREDRPLVRRFAKPVADVSVHGGSVVTMAGEPVFVGATGSPILERAAMWLDCAVVHRLELGSHVLFVGEVVAAGESPGAPGAPGTTKRPAVLRMEDTTMNYGG
jgi:flavin reductase (DIM6/NTAB) family NADH-FMN oxidoreductase RutF